MLKHTLERFDDHTFYLIREIPDDEIVTKDHIEITNAHVYKTIYGAFMAYRNLGVDSVNKTKKYGIYYVHPSSKDIMIPYHFENEDAWYTGEVVICKNHTFHHLCSGILEYERSVFTYEDDTDFAYITFTAFQDEEEETNGVITGKQDDFDLDNLVKGHFSHFWFIRNVRNIKEN